MPPNVKLEGFQCAVPYQEEINSTDGVTLKQESGVFFSGRPSRSNIVNQDLNDGVRNITTAARYTYTLDRFQRNAMLIINSSMELDTTMHNLRNSFQLHRFEAEVIEAKKHHRRSNILEKINDFFQQDFTEIGAVAVVFLTSTHFKAFAKLRDGRLRDQDLMQYFTTNQPRGLQGKPKIFITEGICINDRILNGRDEPPSTNFDDILIIQANMVYGSRNLRPLDLLCCHLNMMKNDRNLMEELSVVLWGAAMLYPVQSSHIVQLKTTLTKQLLLERSDNEPPVIIAPSIDVVEEHLVKQAALLRRRIRIKKLKDYFNPQWYLEEILVPKKLRVRSG